MLFLVMVHVKNFGLYYHIGIIGGYSIMKVAGVVLGLSGIILLRK